ncbi:hypothetical protein GS682_14680 [Nostoc sp. B(2019)]|nr:hypothetical protein [Nostoc sp. B(2019)]
MVEFCMRSLFCLTQRRASALRGFPPLKQLASQRRKDTEEEQKRRGDRLIDNT